jgi:hypothetical protein
MTPACPDYGRLEAPALIPASSCPCYAAAGSLDHPLDEEFSSPRMPSPPLEAFDFQRIFKVPTFMEAIMTDTARDNPDVDSPEKESEPPSPDDLVHMYGGSLFFIVIPLILIILLAWYFFS